MTARSYLLAMPLAATLAAAAIASAPAFAAAQGQAPAVNLNAAPAALVQAAVENVLATIQTDPDTRNGDIGKIVGVVQRQFLPYTDFERTTRLAVGPAWRDATPEQKRQLFEQFQALLVRSYALSLTQLREQNVKFKYQAGPASGNDAVVETHVFNNGDDNQIDYRLQRTATGWKIYDINMMGAWLIEIYRKQFADIVARDGVDGLLNYLSRHNARQGR